MKTETRINARALMCVSAALGYMRGTGYNALTTQASDGFHEYFLEKLNSFRNLGDGLSPELVARISGKVEAAWGDQPECRRPEWWQGLGFDLAAAQNALIGETE